MVKLRLLNSAIKCSSIFTQTHLETFNCPTSGYIRLAIDVNDSFIKYLIISNEITKKVINLQPKKNGDLYISTFQVIFYATGYLKNSHVFFK